MNNDFINYSIENLINNQIEEHQKVTLLLKQKIEEIKSFSNIINHALINNKKILTCGNGGSAADSIHLSSEIVGRYEKERKGFSSLSLASAFSGVLLSRSDLYFVL